MDFKFTTSRHVRHCCILQIVRVIACYFSDYTYFTKVVNKPFQLSSVVMQHSHQYTPLTVVRSRQDALVITEFLLFVTHGERIRVVIVQQFNNFYAAKNLIFASSWCDSIAKKF